MRPHRRQPIRLRHPWDSPGKNTGVGCHFLLQCMKVKSESEVAQLCPTLSIPWTAAYEAPPSMGFSRQECWSGVPLLLPGFSQWYSGKESAWWCRRRKRHGFNPWIRKIPWSKKWQPTPIFLPGKFMDRETWWATVPGVTKSRTGLSKNPHTSPFFRCGNWNFKSLDILLKSMQLINGKGGAEI